MRGMVPILALSFWLWSPVIWAGENAWTSIGPYGGSIRTIVIDRQDPEIMYGGTEGGGVFKSIDGGLNWRAINQGFPADIGVMIFAMAADPSDSKTLYAGTGWWFKGVFKSTDGGGHWEEIEKGLFRTNVRAIAIDATNPWTIYVGMERSGVFKSMDGGGTWKEANTGLSESMVYALAVHPQYAQTLYAGTRVGMFRTVDGGETWKATDLMNVAAVRCIAFDSSDARIMYAGTPKGVYKSTDGGEAWIAMTNGMDNTDVRSVAVDPQNPQVIYAATDENVHTGLRGEVYKSTDSGGSWMAIGTGLTKFGMSVVAVDPGDSRTVYAGSATEDGMFKSRDGGAAWAKANQGLTNIAVFSIAIDPTNPEVMYASTEFTGVYKSMDGGIHWRQISNGLKGIRHKHLTIDPADPQSLYVVNQDGLFKSINGGESWTRISTAYSFGIDPQDSQHMYAAVPGDMLIESIDGGETWREVGPRPGELVAIDPWDSHTLYFGKENIVFKSTDGGLTWTSAELPGSPAWVSSLVIDPFDPETIYAGRQGLFKSTDGGASWRRIQEGLTSTEILDIRIDLRDSQVLYASTGRHGLFVSWNGGERWEWVDTGQLLRVFFSVADPQNPDIVYIGTDGDGAFKGVIHTGLTGVEEQTKELQPRTFRLYPNYPNPFNSETIIGYELPMAGEVRLGIYNLKGQLVRALIDDRQTEGYYSVGWDGRDDGGDPVSSGIYIYRLKARNGVKARKMLVLR